MATKLLAARGIARRRPSAGGFTLIELLVVVAVIGILAAMLMPAILSGLRAAQTTQCIANQRQIVQSYVSYGKDYDSWMVCGGNRNSLHPAADNNQENHWEDPWNSRDDYPFWHEALQPYINSNASMPEAIKSYKAQTGTTLNPATLADRDKLRTEMGRLCAVYTCPAKKQSVFGYGYNYDAPFGNAACYPNSMCPVSEYSWFGQPYPINFRGARVPVPILWYAKNVHMTALTIPSAQIAFCDTGFVTNDGSLNVDPVDWTENNSSNLYGFTRFPLHDTYTATANYKTSTPWRPVPRHGEKAVCAMFDGSTKAIHIRDVVGHKWADKDCLFDNKPPHKPPVPPKQE